MAKRKFIINCLPRQLIVYSELPYKKVVSFKDSPKEYVKIINTVMNFFLKDYVVWIEEVSPDD